MSDTSVRENLDLDELRARLDAWIEDTGRDQLARSLESAERARDTVRAVLRVDQQTLNYPVTL